MKWTFSSGLPCEQSLLRSSWANLLPLPDLFRKIEGDCVCGVALALWCLYQGSSDLNHLSRRGSQWKSLQVIQFPEHDTHI